MEQTDVLGHLVGHGGIGHKEHFVAVFRRLLPGLKLPAARVLARKKATGRCPHHQSQQYRRQALEQQQIQPKAQHRRAKLPRQGHHGHWGRLHIGSAHDPVGQLLHPVKGRIQSIGVGCFRGFSCLCPVKSIVQAAAENMDSVSQIGKPRSKNGQCQGVKKDRQQHLRQRRPLLHLLQYGRTDGDPRQTVQKLQRHQARRTDRQCLCFPSADPRQIDQVLSQTVFWFFFHCSTSWHHLTPFAKKKRNSRTNGTVSNANCTS